MTASDKPEFVRRLAETCSALRVPLTQETANLYWRHLSDLSLDAVLGSLDAGVKAQDRLPSIAAIRSGCEAASGHSVGSQTPGRLGRADCDLCSGTGWHSVTVQSMGQSTRLARRCQCRKG